MVDLIQHAKKQAVTCARRREWRYAGTWALCAAELSRRKFGTTTDSRRWFERVHAIRALERASEPGRFANDRRKAPRVAA